MRLRRCPHPRRSGKPAVKPEGRQTMARGAALTWSVAFASLAAAAAAAAAAARADVAVSVNDGHTVITPAGPASSPTPRPDTLSVIDLSADPPRVTATTEVP